MHKAHKTSIWRFENSILLKYAEDYGSLPTNTTFALRSTYAEKKAFHLKEQTYALFWPIFLIMHCVKRKKYKMDLWKYPQTEVLECLELK